MLDAGLSRTAAVLFCGASSGSEGLRYIYSGVTSPAYSTPIEGLKRTRVLEHRVLYQTAHLYGSFRRLSENLRNEHVGSELVLSPGEQDSSATDTSQCGVEEPVPNWYQGGPGFRTGISCSFHGMGTRTPPRSDRSTAPLFRGCPPGSGFPPAAPDLVIHDSWRGDRCKLPAIVAMAWERVPGDIKYGL